jgi:N6-adenosine-specific RNA methylase IME4
MLRLALRRKHLNAGQRGILAARLLAVEHRLAQGRRRQRANLKQHAEVATLPPRDERIREELARTAAIGERSAQDVLTVTQHAPELEEAVLLGEVSVASAARRVRRERVRASVGDAPPLPDGPFELIYADPPWQLGNQDAEYAPENYYPTLPLAEIKALPVPAAERAVLFLWAVTSHLPQALEVLAAWSFEYRSHLVWVKDWIGLGVWVRHRHELLLIGRRGGHPPPDNTVRVDSVLEAKRGRHSEKPQSVYALLERMYPHASKLELFARGKPREGWAAWGNEVEQ